MRPIVPRLARRVICSVISASFVLITSCGVQEAPRPAQPPPLRIGLVAGVTGPTAAFGEADRRGAELAAHDHGVELVFEDDQGRPEQSAVAVERLITSANVAGIIGCDTSGETLAASPIAESHRVVMISPTASAPQVTKGKRYTFRVCATDDFEARAAAKLARERLHAARVAILRDTKNDYSVGMTATFTTAFTAAGGTIAGTFDYAEGDNDFRAQLTSAAATKPDAFFLPGYYSDVAPVVSQARDLGITAPFFGGSGWDSPKLREIGGSSIEGCWFVSGMRSALPTFVASFRAKYGIDPDAANAQSYDAASILCEAVKRARGDREQVRALVASTRNFHGASGTITIDANGNATKPLGVFHIVGGRFVQEGAVEP